LVVPVVVPEKKRKRGDSMQPIPFFPPRTLAYTLPQQNQCFSVALILRHFPRKNVNKIKTAWCDAHFRIFFSRTNVTYAAFGTSTDIPFHRTNRKHSVIKLTLIVDRGLFPQTARLVAPQARVQSAGVSEGQTQRRM